MKEIPLEQLRPTQMTHGKREVDKKIAEYRSLSGHDLTMAIAEKPVPIVLGPDETPYVTDHHHIVAALHALQVPAVPVVLIKDLSSCGVDEFWLTMENQRWAYPYDSHGQRCSFADMPRYVWDLQNDEYRSIAAFARNAGAFEKTEVPLEEFRWADLFRNRLPLPSDDEAFERTLRDAIELARSDVARGVPGYLGAAQRTSGD